MIKNNLSHKYNAKSTLCNASPRIIFPLKSIHSFKLRIFNIVTVRLCLAYSVRCTLCDTMPKCKPIGVIRQPSSSGGGGEDSLEFIRSVGGREPQIHKLWIFADDGSTREVHVSARIDVGDFSRDCFRTAYATEIGRRVVIYGRNLLMEASNGSAFLPLLAILGWFGLKIYWFPNHVGETDVTTNVGLW